jgi:hypothetical protein
MANGAHTYGKPKVVLSFGARDSALFAQWLYWELRKKPQYHKTNHVYLDTIAMQQESDTTMTIVPMINAPGAARGVAYKTGIAGWAEGLMGGMLPVPELPRGVEQVPSTCTKGGVASFNDKWNRFYNTAVSECQAMIFVVTPAWIKSANCGLEMIEFWNQVLNRRNGKPIRGIALTFPNDQAWGNKLWPEFYERMRGLCPGRSYEQRLQKFDANMVWAGGEANRSQMTGSLRDLYYLTTESFDRLCTLLP